MKINHKITQKSFSNKKRDTTTLFTAKILADNLCEKDRHVSSVVIVNTNTPSIISSENEEDSEHESDVLLSEPELKEPPKYAVVMYNDDYTPMDFVVLVLMSEFRHTQDESVQIMLNIHQHGKGIAGIYPKDIAETKANKVNSTARREGFPLMTQIEPYKE